MFQMRQTNARREEGLQKGHATQLSKPGGTAAATARRSAGAASPRHQNSPPPASFQ